jgi:DNA-binding NtrC family response regulator
MSAGCILCVDEYKSLLGVLRLSLEYRGFEVILAHCGADALTMLAADKDKVTAILSDHRMAEMGGLEFVSFARQRGFKGRIVIMSGNMGAAEFREYQHLSISGFFHKPFDVDMLAQMLMNDCSAIDHVQVNPENHVD